MAANLTYRHKFVEGTEKTTLLLLHGTGGDEDSMLSLGRMISRRSSLLSPRGKVVENGMPRFFKRFGEGVFDVEDLKFRSGELASFVKEASVEYKFEVDAVIVIGYSNGANIAASIILLELFRFAGAILFRPMVPLVPSHPPNLTGLPILIAAGNSDRIVLQAETERLAALLRKENAEITLNWQAGGHELKSEEIERAKEWFDSEFLLGQH